MFKGKNILITAGPTKEAIDPVRFISNHSSGKMGYAIAEELFNQGANVILVSGPVSIATSLPSKNIINVNSAVEMLHECEKSFPSIDIAIFSAAVADYRPEIVSASKIKKKDGDLFVKLIPNPDIAFEFSKVKLDNQISVGFALETDNLVENGRKKLLKKKFDFVVLNSPSKSGAGFGYDTNQIKILDVFDNLTEYELKNKKEVSKDIIRRLTDVQKKFFKK